MVGWSGGWSWSIHRVLSWIIGCVNVIACCLFVNGGRSLVSDLFVGWWLVDWLVRAFRMIRRFAGWWWLTAVFVDYEWFVWCWMFIVCLLILSWLIGYSLLVDCVLLCLIEWWVVRWVFVWLMCLSFRLFVSLLMCVDCVCLCQCLLIGCLLVHCMVGCWLLVDLWLGVDSCLIECLVGWFSID